MNPRRTPARPNGSASALCAALALCALAACSKPAPPAAQPAAAAPAISAFPADADLRQAWALIYGIRPDATGQHREVDPTAADFAQAETIAQAALAKKPGDPDASVVYAHVCVGFVRHGFDASDARYTQAEKAAEDALQVAPNNPEALAAMAAYVVQKSPGAGGAAQLLHQAIAINPTEPRYHRLLFMGALKGEQQMKGAEAAAEKFPGDYLTFVDLARVYEDFGLSADANKALDRAMALDPKRAPALAAKARLAGKTAKTGSGRP